MSSKAFQASDKLMQILKDVQTIRLVINESDEHYVMSVDHDNNTLDLTKEHIPKTETVLVITFVLVALVLSALYLYGIL